jgi:hypothetical protein
VLDFYINKLAAHHVFLVDFESIRLQVPDPPSATPSARVLIDDNRFRRGFGLRFQPYWNDCEAD